MVRLQLCQQELIQEPEGEMSDFRSTFHAKSWWRARKSHSSIPEPRILGADKTLACQPASNIPHNKTPTTSTLSSTGNCFPNTM
tara:strand:- start:426 stop:677 length:252 start_codon:yes stop_codon:yes gene_type:complete